MTQPSSAERELFEREFARWHTPDEARFLTQAAFRTQDPLAFLETMNSQRERLVRQIANPRSVIQDRRASRRRTFQQRIDTAKKLAPQRIARNARRSAEFRGRQRAIIDDEETQFWRDYDAIRGR